VTTPHEQIAQRVEWPQNSDPQWAIQEAMLSRLQVHILSLLQRQHEAGKVSKPTIFRVPNGIGCAANINETSSIVAHFVGPVTTSGTAEIGVWDSTDRVNPTGPMVAGGPTYGIEDSDEDTKKNQCNLLPFIETWIENGKPGTWQFRNQ
jgi:hypothetical protein